MLEGERLLRGDGAQQQDRQGGGLYGRSKQNHRALPEKVGTAVAKVAKARAVPKIRNRGLIVFDSLDECVHYGNVPTGVRVRTFARRGSRSIRRTAARPRICIRS